MALTISYYEAIKTHRDEFTCLIPTADSPPCSVANLDLFSLLSRGNSHSYWQGPSRFSSCTPLQCHYFFTSSHSTLRLWWIAFRSSNVLYFLLPQGLCMCFLCLKQPLSYSLCQDSHYSDFSKLRPSFLPNWKAVVTPTICCTVNSFLSLVTQHFTLLYWQM